MRRPLRDFALRLVLIAAILLTLGRVFATSVVTPMLPAMAWVIEAVDDRFRVEQMRIADRKADTFIELKATPVRIFMLGNKVLMPDAKLFFEPAILVGSVLQPVILFLAIILAWPGARPRALGLRLLLAVPVIALLLITNVPLGFVGVMLDFREHFPDIPVAPLVYWNDFLQTGGPLALAIAAGILVGATADRWCDYRSTERQVTIQPVAGE
jgi:hypothetical protein